MNPRSFTRRAHGFTLLEILVAVLIFAVIGVLAMTGYNDLLKNSSSVDKSATRVHAVQTAMTRMSRDFSSLEPRPVREPLGGEMDGALRADNRSQDQVVELTHSSWSNPAGIARSTLQRVAYRLDDDKLRRDYWVVLDRTPNEEPVSVVMLDKVKSFKLRYLDLNHNWQEQWPAAGNSSPDAKWVLPIGVEITLELEDWGKLVRIIEVPG